MEDTADGLAALGDKTCGQARTTVTPPTLRPFSATGAEQEAEQEVEQEVEQEAEQEVEDSVSSDSVKVEAPAPKRKRK